MRNTDDIIAEIWARIRKSDAWADDRDFSPEVSIPVNDLIYLITVIEDYKERHEINSN